MEQLIRKAIQGDDDSFAEAIQLVKNEAYKVAYCYLEHIEDSMDVVCNAIEKAYIKIKTLKNPKYFKTWFIRIIINESKNMLTKRKKAPINESSLTADKTASTSQNDLINYQITNTNQDRRAEKIDLQKYLNQLAHEDRLLIYLKFYLGYTLEEIAEIVDKPAGTVKTRIYKNLRYLRGKLEVKEGRPHV